MKNENKNAIREKLSNDPDTHIAWVGGEEMPRGGYDTVEICGLQLRILLEGYDDVYIICILPGNEDGVYDVYVRGQGDGDLLHMFGFNARDPYEVVIAALDAFPDYLGFI